MRRPRYLLLLSCCAALLVLLLPSAAAASLPRAQIVWAETQETAGYFQDLVEESWMPSPPVKVDLRYRHCPRWPKWSSCMRYQWWSDGVTTQATYDIYFAPRAGARIFHHEIGHVFDFSNALDQTARRQLAPILRVGTQDWDQRAHERFAEAYSFCAIGVQQTATKEIRTYYYGFWIRPRQLRRACRIIRASAARTIPVGAFLPIA